MRIRKNTKLSSMLLATAGNGGDKLETYVCPLNQSPWDVIPLTSSLDDYDDGAAELTNLIDSSWFLPSPSSSSPSLTPQLAGEDNSNGNVSLGDSSGPAQRFNGSIGNNHSLVSDERLHHISPQISPDVEDPSDGSENNKSYSVEPHSPVKTSGDDHQAAVSVPAPPKRGRPRGSGKKAQQASSTAAAASNNNPYEFYYYSGFGPRWGRKRGGSGDEKIVLTDDKNGCEGEDKKSNSSGEESSKTAAFEHGSGSFDGFEFMEEDYDVVVDQSIGHGKKMKSTMTMAMKKMKRGRKPVKERSLKSLM